MGRLNENVKQSCSVRLPQGKHAHTFTRVSISKQPVAWLTITGVVSNSVMTHLLADSTIALINICDYNSM